MDWVVMEGEGSNRLKNEYHTTAFFKLDKYAAHFQDMSLQTRFAEIKGKGLHVFVRQYPDNTVPLEGRIEIEQDRCL
jgi:hypothetical protein